MAYLPIHLVDFYGIYMYRQKYQSHRSYGNGMRVESLATGGGIFAPSGLAIIHPVYERLESPVPDTTHTSRQHAARSEHRLLSEDRQIHVGPVCKRLAGFLL